MSTYKEIVGKKIKKVTSDPSDSVDGQMWYNSTTGSIRGLAITEAYSSSANLGQARKISGCFGSQTAAAIVAGQMPGSNYYSNTEHYDGTGFSSSTAYPASGYSGSGAGTQTAGLIAGGFFPGTTRVSTAHEYDGSSWTSTNSLPGAMDNMAGCGTGTQTNVIFSVGRTPSSGNSGTNSSVTYDGTNFGSGPNINTARMFLINAGAGTGTAALICGGFIDPSPNSMTNSEEYDGSSWSNGGTLNTSVGFSAAWGTQTNAVAQVDSPNYEGSEKYDGTSWTALPDIGIANGSYYGSAGSTGDAGFFTSLGSNVNQTVEFNRSINVITAAAWASGGNMNTGRYATGGAGTRPAAIAFGGYDSSTSGKTEEYDGTSWTENNDMGTGRFYVSGSGTQTAALAVAGRTGPGPSGNFAKTVVEEYDGTSWSEQNDIPSSLNGMMGAGTQTAAVHFGGIATPGGSSSTGTLEYDGTNWTSGGALPTAAKYGIGVGTQTAALHAGGGALGSYYYNGTSWSDQSSNLLTQNNPLGIFFAGMSGTQTSALIAGGGNPSTGVTATDTQEWNGTSWFTQPSLGTARNAGAQGGVGTATTGIAFGGQGSAPPYAVQNGTEEFTPESTSVNVKTITTS